MLINGLQREPDQSIAEKAQGALLGAAIGDALGWPQEFPKRRVPRSHNGHSPADSTRLQPWVRRDGAQYFPHEEDILAGEYSDDTQLLLCTARSLIQGAEWWEHLASRELTTWKLYERGGGGATNRSVSAWLSGRKPWTQAKSTELRSYFDAGGNGVAMRILPHSVRGAKSAAFAQIACDIMTDGVCTHGHPRALIGAIAYGYAAWRAMRNDNTLRYGQLIEDCLLNIKDWSALPRIDAAWPSWNAQADSAVASGYEHQWRTIVEEMRALLERCETALAQGALSIDRDVLEQLGCFGDQKGSGTISAAASIFLASRFAADPWNGLVEAANASGADTDTLASMTGGLLGAVCGNEWLSGQRESAQDADYIQRVANALVREDDVSGNGIVGTKAVKKSSLETTKKTLSNKRVGDLICLPNGREARIIDVIPHRTRSKTTVATSWKLETVDGQSLYIKKLSRVPEQQGSEDVAAPDEMSSPSMQPTRMEVVKLGIRLPVNDLNGARNFYADVLGLKATAESTDRVKFDCGILLEPMRVPADRDNHLGSHRDSRTGLAISLEIRGLHAAFDIIRAKGARVIMDPIERGEWWSFRCLDPEGNIVELVERRPLGSSTPQGGSNISVQLRDESESNGYNTEKPSSRKRKGSKKAASPLDQPLPLK